LVTPRHQTQTERDLSGLEAKRKRETEPRGVRIDELAVPHEVEDRGTGVTEPGPELDAIREDRPPLDRIRHLEKRLDQVQREKDEVVQKLLNMAERGFDLKLEVGKKTADETIAAKRDWRGGIIKVALIIAGAIAAFFAGRKS
jgi:hypothetical protein